MRFSLAKHLLELLSCVDADDQLVGVQHIVGVHAASEGGLDASDVASALDELCIDSLIDQQVLLASADGVQHGDDSLGLVLVAGELINNKVKRLALLSVLSDKAANGNMVVVDKFACDEYKTKTVVAMLNAVGAGKKNLLVNETVDAKFFKSAGNIAGVKTTFAGSVNTYDVLNADKLIISVDAAKKLEEVLG